MTLLFIQDHHHFVQYPSHLVVLFAKHSVNTKLTFVLGHIDFVGYVEPSEFKVAQNAIFFQNLLEFYQSELVQTGVLKKLLALDPFIFTLHQLELVCVGKLV